MLTTTGSAGGVGDELADDDRRDVGGGLPVLVEDHLVPALSFDPEAGDRLADGNAAQRCRCAPSSAAPTVPEW